MAQGLIRAIVIVGLLAGSDTAAALEFSLQRTPEAIVATGDIVANDLAKFRQFSSKLQKRPSLVFLSSDGGLLFEGIALGNFFRSQGFATRIGRSQSCASACVFAFLGGVVREVEPGGKLGVHMASRMFSDQNVQKLRRILLDTQLSLDDKLRVITAIVEQDAALAAHVEARYLIRMGVSLKIMEPIIENLQVQMHWLTRQEMIEYNVVNVD